MRAGDCGKSFGKTSEWETLTVDASVRNVSRNTPVFDVLFTKSTQFNFPDFFYLPFINLPTASRPAGYVRNSPNPTRIGWCTTELWPVEVETKRSATTLPRQFSNRKVNVAADPKTANVHSVQLSALSPPTPTEHEIAFAVRSIDANRLWCMRTKQTAANRQLPNYIDKDIDKCLCISCI